MTTQFSLSLSAEWEPEDPEVESIWLLFKKAVEMIENQKVRDEADFWADRVYEKLGEARNHYKKIRTDEFDTQPTSEKDAVYNALYECLWSAYKDRFTKFTESFGYNIRAIFSGDNEYKPQMNGLSKKYPELGDIKKLIDNQKKNWQDTLRDNRNGNTHDGDFRGREIAPINNKETAKFLFIAITKTIEMLGIVLLSYKLPKDFNVVTVNKTATVFDRMHRYEIRHAIRGIDPKPLFEYPYY